jgi:hypothetical protein
MIIKKTKNNDYILKEKDSSYFSLVIDSSGNISSYSSFNLFSQSLDSNSTEKKITNFNTKELSYLSEKLKTLDTELSKNFQKEIEKELKGREILFKGQLEKLNEEKSIENEKLKGKEKVEKKKEYKERDFIETSVRSADGDHSDIVYAYDHDGDGKIDSIEKQTAKEIHNRDDQDFKEDLENVIGFSEYEQNIDDKLSDGLSYEEATLNDFGKNYEELFEEEKEIEEKPTFTTYNGDYEPEEDYDYDDPRWADSL